MVRKIKTDLDVAISNYLFYCAFKGITWAGLDKGFLRETHRSEANWKAIYSCVLHQIKANPNDSSGHLIFPRWVKENFVSFRLYKKSNTNSIDMWKPKKTYDEMLTCDKEVVPVSVKEEQKVAPENGNVVPVTVKLAPKKVQEKTRLAYTTNKDKSSLNLVTIDGTPDFIKGYLKAMNAHKIYRITMEEINENAL